MNATLDRIRAELSVDTVAVLMSDLSGQFLVATDARGIEVAPDAVLAEGSILRVVVSARRAAEERDAHA